MFGLSIEAAARQSYAKEEFCRSTQAVALCDSTHNPSLLMLNAEESVGAME